MKLLITFSFASLLLFSMSCKKCQECTTTTQQGAMGFEQTTSTTSEYCGDEYDNAPATGTVDNSANGVTQIVTITCSDQ